MHTMPPHDVCQRECLKVLSGRLIHLDPMIRHFMNIDFCLSVREAERDSRVRPKHAVLHQVWGSSDFEISEVRDV